MRRLNSMNNSLTALLNTLLYNLGDFYLIWDILFLIKASLFFQMTFRESSVNQTDLQRQTKYTSTISFCRVCGDEARYFHYGGFVCSSCKTFFRRHASYTKVYIDSWYNINLFMYYLESSSMSFRSKLCNNKRNKKNMFSMSIFEMFSSRYEFRFYSKRRFQWNVQIQTQNEI
jgi:hypothetical protein